ncbi:MAG: hypothetical protein ACYTF9_07205 [Planctomycetota bacterium]
MSTVDQFESVFRSADKPRFEWERPSMQTVLLLSDKSETDHVAWSRAVLDFLGPAGGAGERRAIDVTGASIDGVASLLETVERYEPDLICTYRHLHSEGWQWPFTLGDHVEVLTQATSIPVLVLPHPTVNDGALPEAPRTVMALTDHLAGDHRLVRHAAAVTAHGGTLWLTHVEDDAIFERYLDTISRIEAIDTDVARQTIADKLMTGARDYIATCRTGLAEAGLDIEVEEEVTMGHRLHTYIDLIEKHAVDLLVFNTKVDDQLAMHGMAYPLAVQVRNVPMLML